MPDKEYIDMYRIEEIEQGNTGSLNDLLDEMWELGWKTISVIPRGRSGFMVVFINRHLEHEAEGRKNA